MECVHGAFGALRSLAGGAEQRASCGTHGGRAATHARKKFFNLRPERGNRGIDRRAPLILSADGGAFFLGMALLGDIFMGGYPTTAWQRFVLCEYDATVAGLHEPVRTNAFCHAVDNVAAIIVDVAGKQSSV